MMHHRAATKRSSTTRRDKDKDNDNHDVKNNFVDKRHQQLKKGIKYHCAIFRCFLVLFLITGTIQLLSSKKEENEVMVPIIRQQQSLDDTKTVVILIGNVRGGEPTWESLYHNLLEPNQADLALVVGKVSSSKKTSSLYQRAKFVYEFQEQGSDWSPAIDDLAGGSQEWRSKILPFVQSKNNWSGFLGGVGGIGGSGAIHFLARYYTQLLIQKHDLTTKYDRFVITRADHYYACPTILSELDNREVWVPKGEDYSGICDRHVVCNATSVMVVLNILPSLLQHAEDWYRVSSGALQNVKPEQFLKLSWQKQGILRTVRRMDRTMFTVMEEGVDTTRGRTASSNQFLPSHPKLKLKYPKEYHASECTCRKQKYFNTGWPLSIGWCVLNTKWNQRWLGVY